MKSIIIFLFTIGFTPSFATNYYVSPTGNNANNGFTIASAFQTLNYAANQTNPGDTVFILNGNYTSSASNVLDIYTSGTENAAIVYKNYPGHSPIIQLNAPNWSGVAIQGADYITIDGLTIIGNNDGITLEYALLQQLNTGNSSTSGNGIGITKEYNNVNNKPHHNIIKNCTISKCGGGGIYTYNADYITIENNTVFECGWYSPYGNSGISMYQNWNSDSFTGIKNYIIGNTCYRNQNYIPFFAVGTITDGNGIIIDDGRNTQNGSTLGIYNGQTYIANNLIFDNGGRGIHCYESDTVIIVNNTCYQNCKSPTTQEGEFTAFEASNIYYANNISSPSAGIPPLFISNTSTTNIIVTNNLFTSNIDLANPTGTNTLFGTADFVLASTNPTFADFHIEANSLALNAGTPNNAPVKDKDNIIRLMNGSIDIGCYEFQNTLGILNFETNAILVYPNPASDFFMINMPDKYIYPIDIEIYNAIGNKIKTQTIKSNSDKIYIENIQNGLYLIKLQVKETNFKAKILVK